MSQDSLENIRDFLDTTYPDLLPSSKRIYEQALKRFINTGKIKKGFRPMSLFRNYDIYHKSLIKTIGSEEMKGYISSFLDTLDLTDKSRCTYRSGLYYRVRNGTFGKYRISDRLWGEFIKFVEVGNLVKKESKTSVEITNSGIPRISKDSFDKEAKDYIESYKIRGKGLFKEIKSDILNFIFHNLYGDYEKDCNRLKSLPVSQKEIYEQYKVVITSFMDTYKPETSKESLDKVQAIQVQIKSLTSVIDSLKKELERLSAELSTLN